MLFSITDDKFNLILVYRYVIFLTIFKLTDINELISPKQFKNLPKHWVVIISDKFWTSLKDSGLVFVPSMCLNSICIHVSLSGVDCTRYPGKTALSIIV